MLRVMSGKRSEIARAMEYAMNRAEAADEVGDQKVCFQVMLILALANRSQMSSVRVCGWTAHQYRERWPDCISFPTFFITRYVKNQFLRAR
jgi:hypothetical protein